jgi:hypothetical protein
MGGHLSPGTWVTAIQATWVTLRDLPSFHPCPTRHWRSYEPELRSLVIQEAKMDIGEEDLVHAVHRLNSDGLAL